MERTNYYSFALCHFCKRTYTDLKKCSSCQILCYCSVEHQRLDWPAHKSLCKIIAETKNLVSYTPGCSAEDFNKYKSTVGALWITKLQSGLKPFEWNMWMFPKVCKVCYRKDVKIICDNCRSVAYCSEEHQQFQKDFHKKFCDDLKLCLQLRNFFWREPYWESNISLMKPNKRVQNLPKNLNMVMELLGRRCGGDKSSNNNLSNILLADVIAPGSSIIYALETTGFVKNRRSSSDQLTIHIVGADDADSVWFRDVVTEFLSHWILNLKNIRVFLIGPKFTNTGFSENGRHLCVECQAKGVIIEVRGFRNYYHDISLDLPVPDIVVVFNCGFHEFDGADNDTWRKSIPLLIQHNNVPLVLTSYTQEEIQKDLACFDSSKFKYIVTPEKNRYANLKPMRNWQEGLDEVYFENNYIAIITKVL